MAIYVLNLGVDLSSSNATNNANGDFMPFVQPTSSTPATSISKAWLTVTAGTDWSSYTYVFNARDQPFTAQSGDLIGIRVFYLNPPPDTSITGKITAVIGRAHNAPQAFRTPFGGTPNACNVFDTNPTAVDSSGICTWPGPITPATTPCFALTLNRINRAPARPQPPPPNPPPPPNHRYQFIVGASIWAGTGDGYTWGHDPELEVSMGN